MHHILPRNDPPLSTSERTFLRTSALHQSRLSGRAPSESRPIRLSFTRSHNNSECVSQLGRTRASASVTADLIPPPNGDRPNDGQVKFNVDVGPMGCPGYDLVLVSNYAERDGVGAGDRAPYLQRLKANRILRLLERTLLIGGSIDAEALCVQSGVWVWRLVVDVSLMDDGGNAVDACVLAAVAALRHYRLPEVELGGGELEGGAEDAVSHRDTTIIHSDDREPTPLPLHHTPLTATFALFSDESGINTSVSVLLDPTDREELACNGLLTWSFNKYGEMCCLDYPGGCELRQRQLMASSNLGKTRCVEICEMLETALAEAESQAQKERMERLKNYFGSTNTAPLQSLEDQSLPLNDNITMGVNCDDIDARTEDEQYRQLALDYSSGHFAASVKEDAPSSSHGKNRKPESSSLFQALLHSAQSSSLECTVVLDDTTRSSAENDTVVSSKHVTIIDVMDVEKEILETGKRAERGNEPKGNHGVLLDSKNAVESDEEEEVIQFQSEFSVIAAGSHRTEESPKAIAVVSEANKKEKEFVINREDNVVDDVDDLTMAVKKKKTKKRNKK